ncbi:MBL fold metallo-hydrolase [Propioniciclava soli]|uniref:MBL fold metallo-hydrolase n=1 Tax=Propioniciclava soli TaxID=2775081 RepID=A0ABZ3C684_9ACTN|nr:MBL fold metallo-hydrolase [Propioniciclava soli]
MLFSLGPFIPVADRVFVAVAEPEAVNIGLVVGTTGALVIDTGSTPAQGAAILAAARAVAGDVPVTHVVVTHAHVDHHGGLGGFASVSSHAHRGLASAIARTGEQHDLLRDLGLTADDLVAPTHTFSLATTLDLGDAHAEVVHFGRGHTDHDAVVIVPARKVVFAGDLLEQSAFPSVGEDSFLAEWPRTLDGTLGTLRRDTVIVPGHGSVMDQSGAFIQRAELAWLESQAGTLWDAGTAAADAWPTTDEWPLTRQEAEAALTVRFAQYAAAGRPRARTLPLLGR